jgi:hypothetical protein
LSRTVEGNLRSRTSRTTCHFWRPTCPQQPPGTDFTDTVADNQPDSDTSPLGRRARKLKVRVENVQDIFEHGERGLQIIISAGKLDKQLGAATKQIALLVAAGRQAAGDDEDWTDVNEIRRI